MRYNKLIPLSKILLNPASSRNPNWNPPIEFSTSRRTKWTVKVIDDPTRAFYYIDGEWFMHDSSHNLGVVCDVVELLTRVVQRKFNDLG